jgi:endonuclease/exonuclease/phosphatase family metal-dependent hydrolase
LTKPEINPTWMIMGDFNLYLSLDDRNREGGGRLQDVLAFIDLISHLGLQEIPLKGRKFTCSNMQQDPLLEQLDWCFTSVNWILDYPNTLLSPLTRPISNHIPCVATIGTSMPKAQIFWFENHWLDQPGFMEIV